MELLRSVLKNLPEFQELTAALEGGKSPAAVSGLAAVHRAHFAAALGQETGRPVVVVCADEGEAGRMARDLSYLTGGEVPVLASRSFVFHSIATVATRQGSSPRRSLHSRSSRLCSHWRETVAMLWNTKEREASTGTSPPVR